MSLKVTLLLLTAFIMLMMGARFFYSGECRFIFLLWNLFLSWIPLALSRHFSNMHQQHWVKQAILLCTWLLFFPNSLYVVTDLVHLNRQSIVPVWFDAILIFTAAVTSIFMGFVSLQRLEKYLHRRFPVNYINRVIAMILFMSSFGVYLGRFLRWNSWDIIGNPVPLMHSIAVRMASPASHGRTWVVTLLLTVLFYLLWLLVKKMPGHQGRATI